MKTYFGVIQGGISFKEVETKLVNSGIKIVKHYPKFKIVKFETDKNIPEINFDFFITVEEEKEDFFIQ
ncbi:MAG TPA: hypothetical protein GXX42_03300 [Petrimonas sp.]|uniref:Uncharacterized protein n=1 Tax=bioreactor metagenome TaxID=1076179 RepID=A0A645F3M2_9ZZZZ|nr:hypothetical protein [Petrimonas sp.]OJV37362.1 MAG: hypothetical protein BGO33_00995 [Bacteroidia bacterium 43-41]MEA4978871.1 hypothetical protein [Petrimonas sp.]MEA5044198.1 hypothetical protein [Petrimonas sp.]MEA5061953.1 hypothetical protein [Petrimonas sp.]